MSRSPRHLLPLHKALADHLVDRRLDEARRDRLAMTVAVPVVGDRAKAGAGIGSANMTDIDFSCAEAGVGPVLWCCRCTGRFALSQAVAMATANTAAIVSTSADSAAAIP